MAKNIDFMGAIFPDVPSVKLPQQGGGLVSFDDTTDATATASEILSGYTAYANGQKLVGTASGGITPSGTYSITSNGIYDIVSFASVDVNVSGGGGGSDAEDGIIDATISEYSNDRVSKIASYAFCYRQGLSTVSFPNVMSIGSYAFNMCAGLRAVSFPKAQYIYSYAFNYCSYLTDVDFPMATNVSSCAFVNCYRLTTANFPSVISLWGNAFSNCSNLTTVSFPNLSSIGVSCFANCKQLATISLPKLRTIGSSAFRSCSALMSVYLLSSSVITGRAGMFIDTPISNSSYTGSFGSIYVPASLVDSYKSATNWSYYSARITAYEE